MLKPVNFPHTKAKHHHITWYKGWWYHNYIHVYPPERMQKCHTSIWGRGEGRGEVTRNHRASAEGILKENRVCKKRERERERETDTKGGLTLVTSPAPFLRRGMLCICILQLSKKKSGLENMCRASLPSGQSAVNSWRAGVGGIPSYFSLRAWGICC